MVAHVFFQDRVVEVPDGTFTLRDILNALGIERAVLKYHEDEEGDGAASRPVVTLDSESLPKLDVDYDVVVTSQDISGSHEPDSRSGAAGADAAVMKQLLSLGAGGILNESTDTSPYVPAPLDKCAFSAYVRGAYNPMDSTAMSARWQASGPYNPVHARYDSAPYRNASSTLPEEEQLRCQATVVEALRAASRMVQLRGAISAQDDKKASAA